MRKVLVTGGSGFVGYWMKQTQPKDVEGTYMNRREYNDCMWPVADYYVHLAPVAPTAVLDFSRRYGGRILYASSGAVYDEHPNEYSLNKIAWEKECLDSEQNIVIARLFTFYGERLDGNKAVTAFLRAAHAGTPIRIWGDGETVRSYMYGKELGQWMWAILFRGQNGEAYDVGSDRPITMLELARLITQHVRKVPIILENGVDRVPVYLPKDTAKTRRLLNE